METTEETIMQLHQVLQGLKREEVEKAEEVEDMEDALSLHTTGAPPKKIKDLLNKSKNKKYKLTPDQTTEFVDSNLDSDRKRLAKEFKNKYEKYPAMMKKPVVKNFLELLETSSKKDEEWKRQLGLATRNLITWFGNFGPSKMHPSSIGKKKSAKATEKKSSKKTKTPAQEWAEQKNNMDKKTRMLLVKREEAVKEAYSESIKNFETELLEFVKGFKSEPLPTDEYALCVGFVTATMKLQLQLQNEEYNLLKDRCPGLKQSVEHWKHYHRCAQDMYLLMKQDGMDVNTLDDIQGTIALKGTGGKKSKIRRDAARIASGVNTQGGGGGDGNAPLVPFGESEVTEPKKDRLLFLAMQVAFHFTETHFGKYQKEMLRCFSVKNLQKIKSEDGTEEEHVQKFEAQVTKIKNGHNTLLDYLNNNHQERLQCFKNSVANLHELSTIIKGAFFKDEEMSEENIQLRLCQTYQSPLPEAISTKFDVPNLIKLITTINKILFKEQHRAILILRRTHLKSVYYMLRGEINRYIDQSKLPKEGMATDVEIVASWMNQYFDRMEFTPVKSAQLCRFTHDFLVSLKELNTVDKVLDKLKDKFEILSMDPDEREEKKKLQEDAKKTSRYLNEIAKERQKRPDEKKDPLQHFRSPEAEIPDGHAELADEYVRGHYAMNPDTPLVRSLTLGKSKGVSNVDDLISKLRAECE